MPSGSQIRVAIADDHALVREGLRRVLGLEPGLEVVAEASDGQSAWEACQRERPDVLVLDLTMPDQNGVEVTRRLKREFPELAIVILTIHDDTQYLAEALQAGATAYCLKDVEPDVLVGAIRNACRGVGYVPPALARSASERIPLTSRELEVLERLARGLSNRQIGSELHISEKTARNHISNIFAKLGVQDRTQAALHALQRGWIRRTP